MTMFRLDPDPIRNKLRQEVERGVARQKAETVKAGVGVGKLGDIRVRPDNIPEPGSDSFTPTQVKQLEEIHADLIPELVEEGIIPN